MSIRLLGHAGFRLKGNCHTHSTFSDGTLSPEQVVNRYRRAGYDFIYLTEHCDKLTHGEFPDFAALDSAELRVMPGVEYRNTTVRNGVPRMAMLLGLGTLETSHWRAGLDQQTTIDAINADGGMAVLSCTYWDGRTLSDMVGLRDVTGIEVYNATCENAVFKGYAVTHWDGLLEAGSRVWGLAVDDAHFGAWPDFGLGWVVVDAEAKEPEHIAAAIRAGRFYASCGPEIYEWSCSGDTMVFRCSPVSCITVNYDGPYGQVFRCPAGETLTEAVFEIDPARPFLRVSCRDADGRWAWTNPVWTADLT